MSVSKSDDNEDEDDPNRLSPRMAKPTLPKLKLIKRSLEQNHYSRLTRTDDSNEVQSQHTNNSASYFEAANQEINQLQ